MIPATPSGIKVHLPSVLSVPSGIKVHVLPVVPATPDGFKVKIL